MESPSHPDIEVSKKLIQLVKDKPFLYDKGLEDYRDEAKKTETWKAIAESLHLGGNYGSPLKLKMFQWDSNGHL